LPDGQHLGADLARRAVLFVVSQNRLQFEQLGMVSPLCVVAWPVANISIAISSRICKSLRAAWHSGALAANGLTSG